METTSHCSFPTGENIPMFIMVKINREPNEKSRKNQLRRRVFASYLATVLIFNREAIFLFIFVNQLNLSLIYVP